MDINDNDYKQAVVVSKLLQEAKFEIKGEAVPMAANAMYWLQGFLKRMKEPAPDPIAESPEPVVKKARK